MSARPSVAARVSPSALRRICMTAAVVAGAGIALPRLIEAQSSLESVECAALAVNEWDACRRDADGYFDRVKCDVAFIVDDLDCAFSIYALRRLTQEMN